MYLYCAVVYVCHSVYSSFAQNHSIAWNLLSAPGTEPNICLFLLIHLHKKKSAITVNNFAKKNSNTDHKQKLNFGSIREGCC